MVTLQCFAAVLVATLQLRPESLWFRVHGTHYSLFKCGCAILVVRPSLHLIGNRKSSSSDIDSASEDTHKTSINIF